MPNPFAYFDTLFTGDRLSELTQGFSSSEVHLLCYTGCLLFLYDGETPSDWGYRFISAPSGRPLAKDIDEAIDAAISLGMIERKGDLNVITEIGKAELATLSTLETNSSRLKYLNGATDSLLVLSSGHIREAFEYDINIAYLKETGKTDWLFTEAETNRLFENFDELKKAFRHKPSDLSVPLVSWLKYLIQTGRTV